MLIAYLLIFCRTAIGLVFLLAFVRKAQNIRLFAQTIARFSMLPPGLSLPVGLCLLGGEATVIGLLSAGASAAGLGFVLASLLLLLFSLAIGRALIKNIRTPCNCFGATDRQVSAVDLWRNAGLILCALTGGAAQLAAPPVAVSIGECSVIGLAATIFVAIWLQLGEILHLLHDG